jgi:hypothetical protein
MVLLLTISAALMVSCGRGDETLPSPSPTGTPGETRTAQPTASATPAGDTGSLAEALASQAEVLAPQPLAESILYYAVKEGTHVRVLVRNIVTGDETLVLEYDEPHKAEHDGNYWSEQVPSVGLDQLDGLLVYAAEPDLRSFDLVSGAITTLLRRAEAGTDVGGVPRYRWFTESGQELCCAHVLAAVSVGPAGGAVVQMSQWEGGNLASFSTDGSDVCLVEGASGPDRPTGGADWNSDGELAIAAAGEYRRTGLFVVSPGDPCATREVAHDLMVQGGNAGFEDATWSTNGHWMTATLRSSYDPGANQPVVLVSRDDSTHVRLVPEGVNASPLFSPDDKVVFFARSQGLNEDGGAADWRLWTVDVAPLSQRMDHLPPEWFAQPGLTEEGYLSEINLTILPFLRKLMGTAITDHNRRVIYLSAQRELTIAGLGQ